MLVFSLQDVIIKALSSAYPVQPDCRRARRLVKEGRDPLAERARNPAFIFKAAADALIESKRPGWHNAKHAAQWTATLETYACPKLDSLVFG